MAAPVAAAAAGSSAGASGGAGGAAGTAGGGATRAGTGGHGSSTGGRGSSGRAGQGSSRQERRPGDRPQQRQSPRRSGSEGRSGALQQAQEIARTAERVKSTVEQQTGDEERNRRTLAIGLGLSVVVLLGIVVLLAPVLLLQTLTGAGTGINVDAIPEGAQPFAAIYTDAAQAYGVNPFLLMAVHEDETNFGRSTAPGVRTGVNFAGCCAGPMQFSIAGGASPQIGGRGGTWASFASAYERASLPRPASYPGRVEPNPNVYDSYDAIYAAAKYFHELGAGPRLDQRTFKALLSYKGRPPASIPFATRDFARAKFLEARASVFGGNAGLSIGMRISIAAAVKATPARSAARVIAVANAIASLKLPYCWGGGHGGRPGPSLGISYCYQGGDRVFGSRRTPGLDCSGAIRWLLTLSGFKDPGGIGSGSYGSYLKGDSGLLKIFFNSGHIYATIAGRLWQASPANPGDFAGWGPARASSGYSVGGVGI
jgi:hypothetical protein